MFTCVHFSVLIGRNTPPHSERIDKAGGAAVSKIIGDFSNGQHSGAQHQLGIIDFGDGNVFLGRITRFFFEQMDEIRSAQIHIVCKLLYGKVLLDMTVNIFNDLVRFPL